MQKYLIDQYDSASEMSESRYQALNDLGVLAHIGGGSYNIKAPEDMPSLTGEQVVLLVRAIQSLGMDDE